MGQPVQWLLQTHAMTLSSAYMAILPISCSLTLLNMVRDSHKAQQLMDSLKGIDDVNNQQPLQKGNHIFVQTNAKKVDILNCHFARVYEVGPPDVLTRVKQRNCEWRARTVEDLISMEIPTVSGRCTSFVHGNGKCRPSLYFLSFMSRYFGLYICCLAKGEIKNTKTLRMSFVLSFLLKIVKPLTLLLVFWMKLRWKLSSLLARKN